MNARFWASAASGSPVKLTLKPGQTLHHHYGSRTDEGWMSESLRFSFNAGFIVCERHSDGVDCDGRLESFATLVCPLRDRAAGYVDEHGVAFPAWKHTDGGQRDHSAEAAGY